MTVGGTGIEPVTPTHVKIKKNNGIDQQGLARLRKINDLVPAAY
jgi:hypothetical protein